MTDTSPLVVRAIIGKSWGQGAQHSQALHSFFMHVPGIKVVAPATPYDAKGCLNAAIRENNPERIRVAIRDHIENSYQEFLESDWENFEVLCYELVRRNYGHLGRLTFPRGEAGVPFGSGPSGLRAP